VSAHYGGTAAHPIAQNDFQTAQEVVQATDHRPVSSIHLVKGTVALQAFRVGMYVSIRFEYPSVTVLTRYLQICLRIVSAPLFLSIN
jgi:hypothetical protein